MSARIQTFGSLSLHMHRDKNSLSLFNISVPQLLMNAGAVWSGPCAFPFFKWLTAASISASVNVSVRDLSPVVTLHPIVAISAFTSLSTCLSTFLWRPFSMSLLAMALVLTWHGGVFFRTVGESVEGLSSLSTGVSEIYEIYGRRKSKTKRIVRQYGAEPKIL